MCAVGGWVVVIVCVCVGGWGSLETCVVVENVVGGVDDCVVVRVLVHWLFGFVCCVLWVLVWHTDGVCVMCLIGCCCHELAIDVVVVL